MEKITTYDRNPCIGGYVVAQKKDPKLFKEVIGSCSAAFSTNTEDNHDKEYPYLVSLYDSDDSAIILSGYRVMACRNAKITKGRYNLYTAQFFNYTEAFEEILPNSAEFGRSFSSPDVASLPRAVQIHAFRSIWTTALAPFITECEKLGIHYLFGQVSIPVKDYTPDAIKKMIAFFIVNFGSKKFFEPKKPLLLGEQECSIDEINHTAEACGYTGVPEKDLEVLKNNLNGKGMPMLLTKYPELVGWNTEAIVCNMATNSHVNTIDLPFCLNSKLFTAKAKESYFSIKEYNSNAFEKILY